MKGVLGGMGKALLLGPDHPQVVGSVSVVSSAAIRRRTGYGSFAQFVDQAVITTYLDGSSMIEGFYTVDQKNPIIRDHFDGLMLGSLIIEAAAQVAYLGALKAGLVEKTKIRPKHYVASMDFEAWVGDRLIMVCNLPSNVRSRKVKVKDDDGKEKEVIVFTEPIIVSVSKAIGCWGGKRKTIEIFITAIALV